jgi:uncharacterized iron-regulated membrane protein
MADESLDDLFTGGGASTRPALGAPLALVGVGVFTAVLGMICTSAPGGLMVLAGWLLLERQQQRVDAGALPEAARPPIQAALRATYAGVGLVVVLFLAQLVLYCTGYYELLWGSIFAAVRVVLG